DGRPIPATYTSKQPLTRALLERHFRGERAEHVVGLHSTSPVNTCRWGAYDVDRHDETTDPALTWSMAAALWEALTGRGFRVLLTDSSGRGGYHLRVVSREPVPCRDLHHLLGTIAAEVAYRGESFPKQRAVAPGGFGNWLRLPGRHHTRDHWSSA